MLYHFSCPLHHQPGGNVHRHQLLEQQLGCVWKLNLEQTMNVEMKKQNIILIVIYLRNLSFILASLALECVVPQVGNGDQTTEVTNMDPKDNNLKRV